LNLRDEIADAIDDGTRPWEWVTLRAARILALLRERGALIEDRDAVIQQISDYLHLQVGMKAVKAEDHAPLLLEWIEATQKEQP